MDIIKFLDETTLEIIAIGTVGVTMIVVAAQAINGQDITMPTEPAMMVLGYFFAKKLS